MEDCGNFVGSLSGNKVSILGSLLTKFSRNIDNNTISEIKVSKNFDLADKMFDVMVSLLYQSLVLVAGIFAEIQPCIIICYSYT